MVDSCLTKMSDVQHVSEGSELIWVECSECRDLTRRVFDGKYITEVMAARSVPQDQWPPGEDWSKPSVNGPCKCQDDVEARVKLFVLGKHLTEKQTKTVARHAAKAKAEAEAAAEAEALEGTVEVEPKANNNDETKPTEED